MTLKCEIVNLYRYGKVHNKLDCGTTVRKGYNRAMGGIQNVKTYLDKDGNVIKYVHKYRDISNNVVVVNAVPLKDYEKCYSLVKTTYCRNINGKSITEEIFDGFYHKDKIYGNYWDTMGFAPTETKTINLKA